MESPCVSWSLKLLCWFNASRGWQKALGVLRGKEHCLTMAAHHMLQILICIMSEIYAHLHAHLLHICFIYLYMWPIVIGNVGKH